MVQASTALRPLEPTNIAARDEEFWEVAAHLDVVINSIADHAIFTLDTDGYITSWNRGAEKTKGYTRAEIIGRHFSCFYTQEDLDAGLPALALVTAAQTGRHEVDGWRLRKGGEKFWAHAVIQPIREADGKLRGFVKVTNDVSQRLQVETLRDELHQSQKLEMVGHLTSGVAHDFNNLLTAIEASYQLVKSYTTDVRVERVLGINKAAIDRGKKLITQLLAFSRKQVLSPSISSINELASVFDVLMEKAVGEAIRLRWYLQPDLPSVLVDQAQFQAALLNLVVNARDAMPQGGTLTVSTEQVKLSATNFAVPHDVPAGDYVGLSVSDTGVGMSPEVRMRAIEPFFTTKAVGKGTGLGLSQCYGFARQSGGTLVIDSVEGKGSSVRILLPARSDAETELASVVHRTILLVDDDAMIRALVGEMLRNLGHTVVEAADGHEALSQLRTDGAIDYLFTDIVMPHDMNGLELVEQARRLRPGLPTLLASGYPREVLRDIANIREDVNFVPKPYTMADLLAHIGGGSGGPASH